jgi:hypothetical protein
LSKVFEALRNDGEARRALDGMIETQRILWTNSYRRTGEITDFSSGRLIQLGHALNEANPRMAKVFADEMRKVDPSFR